MPLIACPECGHDVSTQAASCPHCGVPIAARAPAPVVERGDPMRAHRQKTAGARLIALFGVVMSVGMCASGYPGVGWGFLVVALVVACYVQYVA